MKKKIIGGIAVLCVFASALAIFLSYRNPIDNTKWVGIEDGDIIEFGEEYKWTNGEDYVKGSCEVYSKRDAQKALDRYTKDRLALMEDIEETERWGFEDEMEALKKDINKDTFVISENLTEAFIGGEDAGLVNNTYIATVNKFGDEKHLSLYNLGTHVLKEFCEYGKAEHKAAQPTPVNIRDIGIAYKIPEGYQAIYSDETHLNLVNGNKEISIAAFEKTPVSGLLDEHLGAAKYEAEVNGYLNEEQMGPFIRYAFLFEKDGTTYLITGDDKNDFMSLINSIEA